MARTMALGSGDRRRQIENVAVLAKDGWAAVCITLHATYPRLVHSWVVTPITLALVLCICAAVDALLRLPPRSSGNGNGPAAAFPASVLVMALLFAMLVAVQESDWVPRRWKRTIVKAVDVPAGFGLRWINVFFTTSFVRLPVSIGKGEGIGGMSGREAGVVVCVFGEWPLIGEAGGRRRANGILWGGWGMIVVGYVVAFVATAYFVMGVQLVFGSGKREERDDDAHSEDGEGEERDDAGRANDPEDHASGEGSFTPATISTAGVDSINYPTPAESVSPLIPLPAPLPIAEPSRLRGPGPSPPTPDGSIQLTDLLALEIHTPRPLSRAEVWSQYLTAHIDPITYALIFLFCGLPVFLTTGVALPVHIPLTVLCYYAALALPPNVTRILHPILGCSLFTVAGIWLLTVIQSGGDISGALEQGLREYSRGSRYIDWLRTDSSHISIPGAGDIFSTLLDVSIVALALPMFTYRTTLRTHFLPLLLPTLLLVPLSLLIYPTLCSRLGLPPTFALSFPVRSLTLALATPAVGSLGGDGDLTAVLCVTSGIVGVLIGRAGLRAVGVKEGDYVTRGVVMGTGSAAIATGWLVGWDPRAAAMSSLSMVLFGTGMVVLTAVPAVAEMVRGIVGL